MTIDTPSAGYGWRPDQTTFAAADVVPESLILATAAVSAEIDGDKPALHVAYVSDARSAGYVAEGAEIADSAPGLDEVLVRTKKLARLVTISSEQFRLAPTAGQLAMSVARDLIAKADHSYLGDNGAGDAPTGLLHAAGLVDGGEVTDNLDVLIDLVAQLEANLARPTSIVVDPLSWAALRRLKVGGVAVNESLLGAGTTDAAPMLLGLPVLRSPFVPAGTGLVVDRTAIAAAVGQINIAQSLDEKFSLDAVVLRATWRIGWNLVRPNRVGRFTVAGSIPAGS